MAEPQEGAILAPSSSLLLPGATVLITESLRLEKTSEILESDLLGKLSSLKGWSSIQAAQGSNEITSMEVFRKYMDVMLRARV